MSGIVLGIAGRMGSGKDAFGSFLVQEHGFTRYAFADQLKELAAVVGWDGQKDERGRKLLQDLGHGARQVIGQEVWVAAMAQAILRRGQRPDADDIVVTDVRYQNEADWVRAQPGAVVKIERPGIDRSGPEHFHPTEVNVDAMHAEIVLQNDGTLDDLRTAAEWIVAGFRNRQDGRFRPYYRDGAVRLSAREIAGAVSVA